MAGVVGVHYFRLGTLGSASMHRDFGAPVERE